jgi:hypothetical protein
LNALEDSTDESDWRIYPKVAFAGVASELRYPERLAV